MTMREVNRCLLRAMLLLIAGCGSKAKPGPDAAPGASDAAASQDASTSDEPAADAPTVDAQTVDEPAVDRQFDDAEVLDASSDRTGFTNWTDCGWSGGSCVCDGLLACAAVAGGTFGGLGSVQARVCAFDGDVCEYVRFQEQEGGGIAQRCTARLAGAACTNDRLTTSDCVELFRCNLVLNNCPPDLIAPSVINCR